MSLRLRLVAVIGVVSATALGLAAFATYTAFARSQLREIDDSLQRAHEAIEELAQASPPDVVDQIETIAPGLFVAFREPNGDVRFLIPLIEAGEGPEQVDLTTVTDLPWPGTPNPDGPEPMLFRTLPTQSADGDDLRVRIALMADGSELFVGQDLHEMQRAQRQLLVIELVVAASALVLALGVGWVLVGAGLRPLRRVEHTALAIADGGGLGGRVPDADTRTEVGRLATSLNVMLDRIDQAFADREQASAEVRSSEQRMRRFVADVSHELRTPLAAVAAYAELFDRGARSRPEDLERALAGIGTETSRMHSLVEELLLLAQLDEGRPLARNPVDLAALLVDAVGTARTLAPDHPLDLSISDVMVVEGDELRLRQVVDNLLANVRTHTPAGTRTVVELGGDEEHAAITVRDDGPGLQDEAVRSVFERFFRADSSRSRRSGGAGLGLSIVDAIVAAHCGTVDVRSSPGAGFIVSISLPRSSQDDTWPGSNHG